MARDASENSGAGVCGTDPVLEKPAMSPNALQKETVSDHGAALAAKVGFVVGIDAEGDVHVHYPAADRVAVYAVGDEYEIGDHLAAGAIVREQALDDRPLREWFEYVEGVRGDWLETTRHAPEAE